MKNSGQLPLIKKLLEKKEEGFSLIELVVVVAVLSALSAIAIPQFNCFQRKAKASTALAAMRQIQTECVVNEMLNSNKDTFVISNLQGYEIQSEPSNSCQGRQTYGYDSRVISAIPEDTSSYPSFHLSHISKDKEILFYEFQDHIGTDFSNCFNLICSQSSNSHVSVENETNLSDIETNSISNADPCTDVDNNGYLKWTNDFGVKTAPSSCGYVVTASIVNGVAHMNHRFCSQRWPCDQHGQVLIKIGSVAEFYTENDFSNIDYWSQQERQCHPDPELEQNPECSNS